MTKINKLIMHGFKSFARRTELVFGDDFNCVLGPNGSGKSNILDALCFVLGRLGSKSLRAEKTANLVYNGGKTKKPMKQGEVSIFFDNSEKTFPTPDPYVKITRIIKSDGQSVYRINDEKRTRQQILDLMAIAKIDPDGYNIILQGDIVKFTEMHPEDRRGLIEEIAGISVYEEKKQKALKELEKVDEKLKEAEVVLAERKRYLNELKKERDQALKFKELESKIKESKASYLHIQIKREEEKKSKLTEQVNSHKAKIDEISGKISGIKDLIEKKKGSIEDINKDIEQKGEKEQVDIQREVESLKVELATNKTRIDNIQGELDRIDLRKKDLQKELETIDEQISSLSLKKQEKEKDKTAKQEELDSINKKISGFKEDNSIEDASEIEKKIEQIDSDSEKKQKEIEELRKKQQDLIRKKDNLEYQFNSIEEKIAKVKEIEKEQKGKIDQLKKDKEDLKKIIEDLNKKLNEDSSLAVQISEKKREISSAQEELAKLNARNASIKESAARSFAVKSILDKREKGVHGTVASLGNVDSKYSAALEVAAGPRINSIVVEDENVASECIKYLKKNKMGIATFLPVNRIKKNEVDEDTKALLSRKGVHGLAIDLVSYDEKFRNIFSYVFGRTLVVDDIDTAKDIGVGKARMVTLDGDLSEFSGAMQGGFRKAKEGAGFRERDIMKGIEKKNLDISEITKTLATLENRRKENDSMIAELRNKRGELEGEIIKAEKSLHMDPGEIESSQKDKAELDSQIKQADSELEKMDSFISGIIKEITEMKMEKQKLREKVNSIRNPSLIAELNTFEQKRDSLKEELAMIDGDLRSINTEINSMKLPEKEKINDILKQQAKEEENFRKEIESLGASIGEGQKKLEEKEKAAQEFYAKYKSLFSDRSRIEDEISAEEKKIDGLREESKEHEINLNNLSISNAEVSGKLAGLKEDFSKYEGVKINTEKKEEELKKEISKFEKMVNEIGSVNMRALEVYEEIEKEYESLLEKKDKLVSEKDEVLGMMNEIEAKKKELFMSSFDVVNENFQRIFKEINPKEREAQLLLDNPDNPFEGGLNIRVKISGKKYLDIRSLSGGEKTMTALSFIFAIQEFEPHSFYILDEVDAALDKHNSDKLAKLVRSYCGKAQYIVISHNDQVISESDNLYGVSMDEHGITKVTSLKV